MDMQSFEAKERNLSNLLAQEVKDILDLLRFKCLNRDTDTLGFEVPCFVGEAPVIAFLAITEQRIELSAQWEDRPARTHYLLRGGFVNLPVLQEGLQILEAIWETIIKMPAEPEMLEKDWDREIKDALRDIRLLRESRIKMLSQMEKTAEAIHGTPRPRADNGCQTTCGVDITVRTKADKEYVAAMQRIEEEDNDI